jgi:hypothetical protein
VKEDAETVKWCPKAADEGNVDMQFKLDTMYELGRGMTQVDNEDVTRRRIAAEQGDAYAQACLGLKYSDGVEVARDEVEAVR